MTTLANIVLASAALLLSSGAVSAQTSGTADVPFAFRIPGGSLPAGKYNVRTQASGESIARIRSEASRKSVLVMTPTKLTSPNNATDEKARLVFSCRADDCALAQIWLGSEGQSVPFQHRSHSAGHERLAMISVAVGQGQ